MLISKFPLRIVHPCNICADVTESMVFVFPSSQILGHGPSQGLQNILLGKKRRLKISTCSSEFSDYFEFGFEKQFHLKFKKIL